MQSRIEFLAPKKLIGKRIQTSLSDNKTFELWKSFMPMRKEIKNNMNNDLISMQVYDESHDFRNPEQAFEKWASVEVLDFTDIPEGMEKFNLMGGLYAVFIHKGSSTDASTFHYIFGTWLPSSEYTIDHRPHFEILGEKYKNNDPLSEEEIWIPVKLKI